jgi:hypothetical protein
MAGEGKCSGIITLHYIDCNTRFTNATPIDLSICPKGYSVEVVLSWQESSSFSETQTGKRIWVVMKCKTIFGRELVLMEAH